MGKMLPLKLASCRGCPLEHLGSGFVPSDGQMLRDVLIVGEAPGEEEALSGKPFVGTSGKLLDGLLRKAGLDRASFAVHNVLSCRPPKNELRGAAFEKAAIRHCAPNLDDTIARLRPKVILALGNTPLERLCGVSGITRYRGYPLRGPFDTWVVPTYHPSYLLPRRGQKSTSHLVPAVIRDFKLALDIAQNGYEIPSPSYLEDPPLLVAEAFYRDWVDAGRPPLSVDIETPYKLTTKDEEGFDTLDLQILRIGYCYRPGLAMSIPFTPEYRPLHQQFLADNAEKIVWNGYHFDMDVMERAGLTLGGTWIDAMWGWHYYMPDLPRGLESVGSFFFRGFPWKHLSSERPAFYSAADVDCALQNWIGIKERLIANNQLEGFQEFVVELDPILREAGKNGVHIDRRARRALYKRLRREEKRILGAIQPLIPSEVKPRKRYKKLPKDTLGRVFEPITVQGKVKRCTVCKTEGVKKGEHFKGGKKNPCKAAGGDIEVITSAVTEYDRVEEFNPLSGAQLMTYLEYVGHPVGKNMRTGAPTVDDKHLETLMSKYGTTFPLYGLIQELRGVKKSLSTYVEGLAPNKDGVVQTQYTYAPASGRLSSRGIQIGKDKGVNWQNIPHKGDHPYAHEIRKMIIPPEGMVFVEADSSAIEAVMTGYFMGDPAYVEMAQRGIHDAFALKSLGREITDANIKAFKAAAKVEGSSEDLMRARKKRTVHGCLSGDHEVLTLNGWKRIDHLDYTSDQLAEWDPATREILWRPAVKGVDKPFVGEMLHLKGTSVDILCTGDHTMPVLTTQGGVKAYAAADLPTIGHLPLGSTEAASLEAISRTWEAFDGRIYCPQTTTGYFLARRNGKVFVSGNTSYGMTARLMHLLYPSIFPTIGSAQKEIDDFYAFVPTLKTWHHELRVQAHKEHYLQLPFGNYRRWFYDVFTYKRDKKGNVILGDDGKPIIKLGEDGKSCIAQKPQGAAAFFMRQNAKAIAREIKAKQLPFRLPANYLCHDSYTLCVPDDPKWIAIAKELLVRHLTRPIPEMGNLVIGCEVKMGRNWAEMEVI